ncbi:DUF676-domain-containing protein [Pluteus cervinus]|uniref:DUF676-domain-containing protein n=1 Tax=Pluteus cervinus TaxID=181527 RepID=A0ACD3ADM1_9AGAR|nr:DUF676-domain-containing protein [Pluteus cervinus]
MSTNSAIKPIHLLVLVHGMWGDPSNLAELARVVRETRGLDSDDVELHVLLAETNRAESTYDGVDWGGERVAREIADEIEKLGLEGKKVTRFSVTGYSLGGLISRYLVGILHQREFFKDVTPVNFNTVATPHIGLPRYPSFFSSVISSLGPKLLSRTGEQFYCVDKWSANGRPLLEVMADPDRIFFQALLLFQEIRIYANAINDMTVPYVTSAIEIYDPFAAHLTNGIQIEINKEYGPIIDTYTLPSTPVPTPPKPIILSPRWFRSFNRPLLPPAFQMRFPLNLVLYALLPILIPAFISLALVRFKLATRSSQARIRLLESDEANSDKLVHIFAQLERSVEDTVADYIDEPGPISSASNSEAAGATSPDHPILTPLQRRIAANLNKLPLKKELAFFPNVRNAHAVIVCRDIKRFELHKMGEGVVKHWANSFIM